jgi:hypothetical protein
LNFYLSDSFYLSVGQNASKVEEEAHEEAKTEEAKDEGEV